MRFGGGDSGVSTQLYVLVHRCGGEALDVRVVLMLVNCNIPVNST